MTTETEQTHDAEPSMRGIRQIDEHEIWTWLAVKRFFAKPVAGQNRRFPGL